MKSQKFYLSGDNFAEYAEAGVNVALNKPAHQSTTYGATWSADKAVDGALSQCSNLNEGDNQFTFTLGRRYNWWRVDLEKVFYIYRITICNCGGSHLSEYTSSLLPVQIKLQTFTVSV
mgnify:FL=1